MSFVSGAETSRAREMEEHRQRLQLRDQRRLFGQEYNKLVKSNENRIKQMTTRFEDQSDQEELKLEKKLIGLKKKYEERFIREKQRIEAELRDIKLTHNEQINEVKESQKHERVTLETKHKEFMDVKLKKFEIEKERMNS
jgi:hypothetical protein